MTTIREEERMPLGDRTGPWGLGPLTGRRAGFCAGFPVPGFLNRPFWGFPRFWGGRGRGLRRMYWATGLPGWFRTWGWLPAFFPGPVPPGAVPQAAPASAQELEILKQQASFLEKELEEIRAQIKELEEKDKS